MRSRSGLDAREQLERRAALEHDHAAARRACGNPAARGDAQELGLERAVDDVGDPQLRAQQLGRERQAGLRGHARRVAWMRPSARASSAGRLSGASCATRSGANRAPSERASAAARLAVDVDDRELVGAEREGGVADGRAGSAGPEQDDAVEVGVGEPAREALGEAGASVFVANRPPAGEDRPC